MRARGLLVVACALFAPWAALGQPRGPAEVAAKYYDASQASRCKEVWALYSKKMQEHIRAEAEQHVRTFGGPPVNEESVQLQRCWKDGKIRRLDQRLLQSTGDKATVAVNMRGRVSRSRWDIPGKLTDWTEEVPLVLEDGVWKIDGPRPPEPKKAGDRLAAAEVNVKIRPPPPYVEIKHQVFEASAISHVPRDKLEAVIRDPSGWAAVLPSFKAIEPEARTGPVSRARLSFADPATPIPITVRLAGKPNKESIGFTSLFWDVEGEFKAKVYMRGQWYLTTYHDGRTLVKLEIVIDPLHWPGFERLFSAERMANALLDLETAALKGS